MVSRRKTAKTLAAFGAAMASLYVVTDLQSEEIELHFTPDSIEFNSLFPQGVDIDELAAGFSQWNDLVGKTMYAQSLTSIGVVSSGSVLSPDNFVGSFSIGFAANQSSTAFVGFRSAGNVGWFKLDLGGSAQPINYLEGQYGNEGEDLVVGGMELLLGDVNCDGMISLLDVQPFVNQLTSGEYLDKADMNQDGVLNLLDVSGFVSVLVGP